MSGFIAGVLSTLAVAVMLAKAFGLILVGVSWGWIVAAIILVGLGSLVLSFVDAAIPRSF